MLESNLVEGSTYVFGYLLRTHQMLLCIGRQDIPPAGPSALRYGQSVTDGQSIIISLYAYCVSPLSPACISWEDTVVVLDRLRQGVQGRRKAVRKSCGVNGI